VTETVFWLRTEDVPAARAGSRAPTVRLKLSVYRTCPAYRVIISGAVPSGRA
jgi:hypothetical protein